MQEKPLSIAMREINAGVLVCIDENLEGSEEPVAETPTYDNPA